jgi:hypothetical protein
VRSGKRKRSCCARSRLNMAAASKPIAPTSSHARNPDSHSAGLEFNPLLALQKPDQHWLYDTRRAFRRRRPARRPASYWFKTERTGSAQMSLLAEEERDDLPPFWLYEKVLLVLSEVTKSSQLQGPTGCRTSADVRVIVSGNSRWQDARDENKSSESDGKSGERRRGTAYANHRSRSRASLSEPQPLP